MYKVKQMVQKQIKQQDVWDLIIERESQLKKIGSKIKPFVLADEVMSGIVAEPANKINEIPLETRQKLRNKFLKRYGWKI